MQQQTPTNELSSPTESQTLAVIVGDVLVALSSDEAVAHLKTATFDESTPLEVQSVVFNIGAHMRKPVRLAAECMPEFCEAFEGRPIMDRRHEGGLAAFILGPAPVVGRVTECWFEPESGDVIQRQSFWGESAIADITNGVRQSFSVSWSTTENTEFSCTVCEVALESPEAACESDGWTCCPDRHVLWSDAEPMEVTRLYGPAAAGTGIKAVYLDDGLGGELLALDIDKINAWLQHYKSGSPEGVQQQTLSLDDELPAVVAHSTEELDYIVTDHTDTPRENVEVDGGEVEALSARDARICQLEQQLSAVTGKLQYKEAEKSILRAREQGKLEGEIEREIAMFLEIGPKLAGEFLRHIPANPGMAAALMSSGIGASEVVIPDGHNGIDWQTRLTLAARELSQKEAITYEQAHRRLFPRFRPSSEPGPGLRSGRASQPRRQINEE